MTVTTRQIALSLRTAIEAALFRYNLPGSETAVRLLLMIAAHESGQFLYCRQRGGPALGLFQMEPKTYAAVLEWLNRTGKFPARAAQSASGQARDRSGICRRHCQGLPVYGTATAARPGRTAGNGRICKTALEHISWRSHASRLPERLFGRQWPTGASRMNATLITIGLTLLKEAALAIIKRLPWAALIERLLTRLALWALYKLAGMDTNDLKTDTVADLAAALQGQRLPAANLQPPR